MHTIMKLKWGLHTFFCQVTTHTITISFEYEYEFQFEYRRLSIFNKSYIRNNFYKYFEHVWDDATTDDDNHERPLTGRRNYFFVWFDFFLLLICLHIQWHLVCLQKYLNKSSLIAEDRGNVCNTLLPLWSSSLYQSQEY